MGAAAHFSLGGRTMRKLARSKLWIVPLGLAAVTGGWLLAAGVPDMKRYLKMHRM